MATTFGQKLEIQDLMEHKILTIKLGTARTIRTYNNLLHIVRLDSYEQTIDKITNSLKTLNTMDELKDSTNIVKTKLLNLRQKLRTMKPIVRNKRGLINGLGSVIKVITGNMDAQDAERLDQEIQKLVENQNKIKEEVNLQTSINSKMIERFNNITNHINNQQDAIESYLKYYQGQITNSIRTNSDMLRQSQYLNQINYNIDLLTQHLANLAEAVILARLNIISKQILNEDEIAEIYKNLKEQSVSVESDEHVYELLGLQAYYSNSNIVFNVRIPVLSHRKYSMLHIIPLPINNTKILIPKPYIILNQENIQHFDEACPKIQNIYYCKESLYQEVTNKSMCIGNLIQHQPAECQLIEQAFASEISQPESNYILLANVPEITINSSCEINRFKVKGSKLIHFENCSVEINNVIYSDHVSNHWEEAYLYPIIPAGINYSSTIEDLKLAKLKSFQINNKKAIEILEVTVERRNNLIFAILTVNGLIGLSIFIYWVHKKTSKIQISPPTSSRRATVETSIPMEEVPKPKFLWPSLHTKGGRVTDAL